MLQLKIIHEFGKNYIAEIVINKNTGPETLSSFDNIKGSINLEPLKDYIGQKAMISHYINENNSTRLDYEHEKTITKVEKDENGIWFVEYN